MQTYTGIEFYVVYDVEYICNYKQFNIWAKETSIYYCEYVQLFVSIQVYKIHFKTYIWNKK